jgi:Zn ribbon nucleic-acid-binding protein
MTLEAAAACPKCAVLVDVQQMPAWLNGRFLVSPDLRAMKRHYEEAACPQCGTAIEVAWSEIIGEASDAA